MSEGRAPKRLRLDYKGSEPGLALLQCLGVGRAETLRNLAAGARDKIVAALPTLDPRRVQQLVSESFAHIDRAELRPVAIAALEHAPELPGEIIAALAGPKRELLATLPLPVQQRVWEADQPAAPGSLFLREAHGLVNALRVEAEAQFARAALREAAEVPPKQRRAESASLQKLVQLVGPSAALYRALCALYQEIFDVSAGPTVALMRADLLMAIHELNDEARPVFEWDASHTFVCCLDAALREGKLEPRGRALQARA